MSRSRWAVLLGPPLLIVLAGAAVTADAGRAVRPGAGSMPAPRLLGACPGDPGQGDRPVGPDQVRRLGAWWRVTPTVDGAGTLVGWTMTAGLGSGRSYRLELPSESSAAGPLAGRVVVAVDDGRRSIVRVIDLAAGCVRDLDVADAIARRAVADPVRSGFLVHLVARGTRADLGVWHLEEDGHRTLVLGPVEPATLATAGIRGVWATNLAAARDGRVAVQSCDPDVCLTRLLDRGSGRIGILGGDQGDLIGFAGDRLIMNDACGGPPCRIAAWTADGHSRPLATGVSGAAITADGRTVVAVRAAGTHPSAVAIDISTGASRDIDAIDPDAVLLGAAARSGGVETGAGEVGLLRPEGPPAILEVQR